MTPRDSRDHGLAGRMWMIHRQWGQGRVLWRIVWSMVYLGLTLGTVSHHELLLRLDGEVHGTQNKETVKASEDNEWW
jgi:hypothetical protein